MINWNLPLFQITLPILLGMLASVWATVSTNNRRMDDLRGDLQGSLGNLRTDLKASLSDLAARLGRIEDRLLKIEERLTLLERKVDALELKAWR